MIQLGFATAIVPELLLSEVFRLAADIGYDCLEVMCWPVSKAERRYAGVTHIDVNHLDADKRREINELTSETGVRLSALGYYPNCLSADRDEAQRSVEHLKKVMQAAAELEVNCVNSFIGRDFSLSVDDNWPRFLEALDDVLSRMD